MLWDTAAWHILISDSNMPFFLGKNFHSESNFSCLNLSFPFLWIDLKLQHFNCAQDFL